MPSSRLDQMLQFLDEDPEDSFARYAVALELAARGDGDLALDHLMELRRRDPEYLATYYQLGQLLAAAGDTASAEESYRAGMLVARRQNDLHTLSELQDALEELSKEE